MSERERAGDLLAVALDDLDALRGMHVASSTGHRLRFADSIFGFHAQQAIEKSLKAWLAARDIAFPFTHDIKRLVQLLEAAGEEVAVASNTTRFNSFAVTTRYANLRRPQRHRSIGLPSSRKSRGFTITSRRSSARRRQTHQP